MAAVHVHSREGHEGKVSAAVHVNDSGAGVHNVAGSGIRNPNWLAQVKTRAESAIKVICTICSCYLISCSMPMPCRCIAHVRRGGSEGEWAVA